MASNIHLIGLQLHVTKYEKINTKKTLSTVSLQKPSLLNATSEWQDNAAGQ